MGVHVASRVTVSRLKSGWMGVVGFCRVVKREGGELTLHSIVPRGLSVGRNDEGLLWYLQRMHDK